MPTITHLVSGTTKVDITGLSCRQAADKLAGRLGKTSITELMSGKRQEAKGWHIETVEAKPADHATKQLKKTGNILREVEHKGEIIQVHRANKQGINFVGTGTIRKRNPMQIRVTLTPAGANGKFTARGDWRKMLDIIGQRPAQEYSEIAQRLGWSRDAVQMLCNKAAAQGWLTKNKKSGAIFGKKEA